MNQIIRRAQKTDISRIAEILVFTKRMNYRSIFHNDMVSFGEMQVLSTAEEYMNQLDEIWVYDDGIVKGMVHIKEEEIVELYVDHFFQSEGIGAKLISFAVEKGCHWLWVLEKNSRAIKFYQAHGFEKTGIRKFEEGTTEYMIEMSLKETNSGSL